MCTWLLTLYLAWKSCLAGTSQKLCSVQKHVFPLFCTTCHLFHHQHFPAGLNHFLLLKYGWWRFQHSLGCLQRFWSFAAELLAWRLKGSLGETHPPHIWAQSQVAFLTNGSWLKWWSTCHFSQLHPFRWCAVHFYPDPDSQNHPHLETGRRPSHLRL